MLSSDPQFWELDISSYQHEGFLARNSILQVGSALNMLDEKHVIVGQVWVFLTFGGEIEESAIIIDEYIIIKHIIYCRNAERKRCKLQKNKNF